MDPISPMTLEALISQLNSIGWFLGSLCQLAERDWYACVVDDEGYAHTATAQLPQDAITFAMERPPMGRVYSPVAGVLEDHQGKRIDLVALGLIKRKPLTRRF